MKRHFVFLKSSACLLPKIEIFVSKWFEDKTDLASRINNNRRIFELAQNPFLLSIICLIFEKDQTLPERRVELYEKSAVTLLTLFEELKKCPKWICLRGN